jgi:hypothetical protein
MVLLVRLFCLVHLGSWDTEGADQQKNTLASYNDKVVL